MQGMAVPLQSDQELGDGPNVIVRERPQLWKRLRAWQTVLANCPGAPMTATLPAPHTSTRTDVVTWDIGGDAAKDGEPKQGLGAWFYGVWWCAPLGDWPVLASAHITCLELVEVGLGVVMTARWLVEARRIRIRADAMAAFLAIRARRDDGTLSRGAKAEELVAAHETIMKQPEWKQLHDGRREVLTEHTFGESMLLHDAASRNNAALIRDVSAALGVVPKRLELSVRARAYLQDVSHALLEVRRGSAPHVPMHSAALEHGAAGNGSGPRSPFAQACASPHDEQLWRLYETYLLALDDEALAGLPTPPTSWPSSPRSTDSYNNWEPADDDEESPHGWSPYEYLSPGILTAWELVAGNPPPGAGCDTGAGPGAVDTGVTNAVLGSREVPESATLGLRRSSSAHRTLEDIAQAYQSRPWDEYRAAIDATWDDLATTRETRNIAQSTAHAPRGVQRGLTPHVPLHAAALEHGSAANGTGPRTPFAQAWPTAPAKFLRLLNGEDEAPQSAAARAKRASDDQRRLDAASAGPHGLSARAPWEPAGPLDLADRANDRCERRRAAPAAVQGSDAGDGRAAAFTSALALCASGRARARGPGADPIAPSRTVITARAVAPPPRAVDVARAALRSASAAPASTVTAQRGAAELEESQRMLIERSIRDARCDEDGLGIRGASDELLRGLLTAAVLAVEKRFAPSTRGQDRSYWRMWVAWCDLIGTPPLRTNSAANEGRVEHLHRREVALALGAFMTWVTEAEQRGYKIESMLNRLRGVARRHWAVTIRFVSLALVVQASQGLVRDHIDAHGADALRRRSKEPFETSEIVALLRLRPGKVINHGSSFITVGDNIEWQGVVVFINLYCTGGWRKEAIALGPKEVFGGRKLSLGDITYRIGGTLHREPTVRVLLGVTWGDMCYVNPVPCKNDPDNSKFGGSPVPSRFHATQPICLVRELAKYEIMRMRADPVGASKTRRKELPLVLSPAGRSWSKAELSKFFDGLIRMVCSEERAKQLSVHSFRVWLACALLAAGATPEQIMLMVRWSSEAARKLYARLAMSTQCSLQAGAVNANFDSIRAHTLIDASAPTGASADVQAAAEALREATGLLDSITVETGARVASSAELRRTCSIDDDAVFSMLEESSGTLEGLAASADAALTDAGAAALDSGSDDEP